MSRFNVEVRVIPRPGLLDPQGKAVHHALDSLGYAGVESVRVGKLLALELDADDASAARAVAEEMCRKLLANPVTEDFEVTVAGSGEIPDGDGAPSGKGPGKGAEPAGGGEVRTSDAGTSGGGEG